MTTFQKMFQWFPIIALTFVACIRQTTIEEKPTLSSVSAPINILTFTSEPDREITPTLDAFTDECKVLSSEFSLDSQWVAHKCDKAKTNNPDESSSTLKVVNLKNFQEWTISYYQVYGLQEIKSIGEMSDGTVFSERWSEDGKYFFIGVMPQVYTEYYYNRTAALFRLDLETGGIDEILDIGIIQKTFYDFSLSHDEKKIAYVNILAKPLQLVVKDLDTNVTKSVQLERGFTSGGSIVWSKDDSNLIFMTVNFDGYSPGVLNSLNKWNVQTGELVEISRLPNMLDRLFLIVKWDEENNSVQLKNYFAEEFFEIDLVTGGIKPISH